MAVDGRFLMNIAFSSFWLPPSAENSEIDDASLSSSELFAAAAKETVIVHDKRLIQILTKILTYYRLF